ncbi:MAG: putative toxin-antitoxin system toxin component, PIN family [Proteobacteria bacterium]|nr:putative toxin-antitoxin system toxin component, PIN family [Pseudomonadota bacterium]
MRAERTVLDTNILISAFLTRGKPFEVLRWVLDNSILIFSDPTFDELARRIQKPKFDPYVSAARRRELLADLESVAEWTTIVGALQACRDADDDKFLETALAGQANCIVSGDRDLLTLDPFEHVRIVSAASFLVAVSG